jgi:hypothetical protein
VRLKTNPVRFIFLTMQQARLVCNVASLNGQFVINLHRFRLGWDAPANGMEL